jgi:hypothetical protein
MINRYENMSPAEIWDRLVGEQSPQDWASIDMDPHVYIESSPLCADLSSDERATAAAALERQIERAYVDRHERWR